ncbi:MAG: glycosyltransferase family 4 protein [Candidatus Cloacimonetes bacterium]|nr:glycosyltransferase family 4 protein [Candidatus Cloacimonadota bacterium]
MKKIRLMHLQVLPILSGVQNMMIMLLSGLDQDKYEIIVVSRSQGQMVDKVKEKGWEHITINTLVRNISIKDFCAAYQMFRMFKKLKPDIVHTHSSKTGFLGRIMAKLAGVPLVIHTTHGFPFHPFQNMVINKFYILLEIFASFFADFNVFVNIYERELSIHKLGFNKKKAITIFNGIHPYKKQKSYEEAFFKNDTLNIVSVLRFSKQKNIVSTIEQAIRVVKKYQNIKFTFIGDGELFEECCLLVNKEEKSEQIVLCGWVSDVREKLIEYDIFMLNSSWEGLPISILEAMSVGLPVICSNIKGNNELVCDANGWLLEPNDVNSIEKVIAIILKNKILLQEKGKESLNKVTNQFHYELFISEYEKLYTYKGNEFL